ncbi:MAG: HAD family hydrolase [Ktedonobacteraceae bacterium]
MSVQPARGTPTLSGGQVRGGRVRGKSRGGFQVPRIQAKLCTFFCRLRRQTACFIAAVPVAAGCRDCSDKTPLRTAAGCEDAEQHAHGVSSIVYKGQNMQHLLIDGDDTLWENNIYFEQAIEAFIDFLNHSSLTPNEVRAVLDEMELSHGYGSANFSKSLQATYRHLAERDISDEDLAYVKSLGSQILHHPMQVIDGVRETLAYLSPRHRLILLTKGDQDEQQLKVENSGLDGYFHHIIIVQEKDVETYQRLATEFNFDRAGTWMIGNSPRSDINPALKAGLNAVFIPHPHTWSRELQEVRHEGQGRLLTLSTFAELQTYF